LQAQPAPGENFVSLISSVIFAVMMVKIYGLLAVLKYENISRIMDVNMSPSLHSLQY